MKASLQNAGLLAVRFVEAGFGIWATVNCIVSAPNLIAVAPLRMLIIWGPITLGYRSRRWARWIVVVIEAGTACTAVLCYLTITSATTNQVDRHAQVILLGSVFLSGSVLTALAVLAAWPTSGTQGEAPGRWWNGGWTRAGKWSGRVIFKGNCYR
jgi:hypothetical protein